MPHFRRVKDHKAGPQALGILVPPGQKTFLIIRPRGLPWDLLSMRPDEQNGSGALFAQFTRDEAARLARQFQQGLEQHPANRDDALSATASPWGEGYIVSFHHIDLAWVACLRRPGKPYEAIVFPELVEAERAAQQIGCYLYPPGGNEQEYYFNTQHFH